MSKVPLAGLEVRLAHPGDLKAIGALLPELGGPSYSQRFPGSTVEQFCRWKYFDNPMGNAAVGIALSGDRVVSIAAAVPKFIQIGSSIVTSFELGDFITATDYRKRGLFSATIQLICDEAARRGAPFVYVRPNPVSFPILARNLGFLEVRKIDQRRYIVPSGLIHRKTGVPGRFWQSFRLDRMALKMFLPGPPVAGSVKVERVTRFSAELDELWQAVRSQFSFSLVRDSAALNWRYADCPTPYLLWQARRDGRVVGYLVAFVSPSDSFGYVVDLFTGRDDVDAVAALLREGADALFAFGMQWLCTWTLQPEAAGAEPEGAKALRKSCPVVSTPHLHYALRFSDARGDSSSLPSSGWQFALGDFDGI